MSKYQDKSQYLISELDFYCRIHSNLEDSKWKNKMKEMILLDCSMCERYEHDPRGSDVSRQALHKMFRGLTRKESFLTGVFLQWGMSDKTNAYDILREYEFAMYDYK